MNFSHSYRCLQFVRIMLAIVTFYEIWQMDVKTAFLNGFLKEDTTGIGYFAVCHGRRQRHERRTAKVFAVCRGRQTWTTK